MFSAEFSNLYRPDNIDIVLDFMTVPMWSFVHDPLTTISNKETFLRESEANASEFLENLE